MSPPPVSVRIDDPDVRQTIRQAASLSGMTFTAFIRHAAKLHAKEVLRREKRRERA